MAQKYQDLWELGRSYIQTRDPKAWDHVESIVYCAISLPGLVDLDVAVPAAVVHEIGSLNGIPKYLKQSECRVPRGGFANMLVGWRVGLDLLEKVEYPASASQQALELVGMHESEKISGAEWRLWYDTPQKKLFHDLDVLSCFGEGSTGFDSQNPRDSFFDPEIRRMALRLKNT